MQLRILTQKIDSLENKLESQEQLKSKIISQEKTISELKSQLIIKHKPITNYYS